MEEHRDIGTVWIENQPIQSKDICDDGEFTCRKGISNTACTFAFSRQLHEDIKRLLFGHFL